MGGYGTKKRGGLDLSKHIVYVYEIAKEYIFKCKKFVLSNIFFMISSLSAVVLFLFIHIHSYIG